MDDEPSTTETIDPGGVRVVLKDAVWSDKNDAENDVLYLYVGQPQVGEGEETQEGHVIRYAPGTNQVVGLTVLGVRRILQRDGRLAVTVPETVETSAEELASALAAV